MSNFFKVYIIPFLLLLVILFIFRAWFTLGAISGGDFDYIWSYKFFTLHPYAWNSPKGEGFGTFFAPVLWVFIAQSIPMTLIGNLFHLPWEVLERISIFYPFLILSLIGPMLLYRNIVSKKSFYYFSSFIFLTNTYILNILQGGQMIFALAVAFVPIAFSLFLSQIQKPSKRYQDSIIAGLALSLQVLLDIRVAYILIVILLLYFCLYSIFFRKSLINIVKEIVFVFLIPGILVLLLHLFWILPILFYRQNAVQQLGSVYNSLQAVQFFSFAKFENSFSLLHPNWPENIFGKVYFMRPEFIVLPILAYMSLLFLQYKEKNEDKLKKFQIIFFALLGIIGAFLAKGSNEPFGVIYLWLFNRVPGFVMFRDPTKWYILVIFSYAILIPFTISQIYEWLRKRTKKYIFIPNVSVICILVYLLFLIKPALGNQLHGSFKTDKIPYDYSQLANILSKQKVFSRTLWLPIVPAYGYSSVDHPAITGDAFFNISDTNKLIKRFSQSDTQILLQEGSVQYVILPYDSEGRIFTKDGKYDNSIYQKYVISLRKIHWLHEVSGFKNMHVFTLSLLKDHFWTSSPTLHLNYVYENPTHYHVGFENGRRGDSIIFSEKYDPNWELNIQGKIIKPQKYHTYFMRFVLPEEGNTHGEVTYVLQKYVDIGSIISLGILLFSLFYIILNFFQKK